MAAPPPVAPPVPVAPVVASPAPMLGVVPTSAGPSRARIRTEFDRVNKETFVENMLRQTANALASDAEFGNNSANQIRDRVEDLADEMAEEDPATGLPEKSAGRAVVEARFALGGDNGQYMSQAVAMLWAGDGGERLRIVPPSMMPQIMRHASAEGIIRAMRSVMVTRQAQSTTKINTGLELAGWMMQVDEIRNAVLDYMRQTGLNEVVTAADTIEATYTTGTGMEWVMNVLKHSDDIAANYAIAKAIVEAVYVLSDPGSYPMQVVQKLLDASEKVVKKAYDDTMLVAVLGQLIGREIQDWQSFDPNDRSDTRMGFCPEYDAVTGLRIPGRDGRKPKQRQFQTAVAAACARIGATQKVKYFDVAAGNVAVNDPADGTNGWRKWDTNNPALPAGKEWYLDRVLTPMWNQGPRVYPYAGGTPGGAPADKGAFYTALGNGVPVVPLPLDDLHRKMQAGVLAATDPRVAQLPRTDPALAGLQSSDPWMIEFCIIRGLCGYQGPHQTLPAAESRRLPYNYPETEMQSYYRAGLYSNTTYIPNITLGAETRAEIATVLSNHYASTGIRPADGAPGIELDTDYFGYAWKEDSVGGIERALEVHWAPIKTTDASNAALADGAENNDVDYSPMSLNICEASIYEMMAKALLKRDNATTATAGGAPSDHQKRTLRAAAASAKIRQLQCMAFIASENSDDTTPIIKKPSDDVWGPVPSRAVMVTRPAQQCAVGPHKDTIDKLLLPVDAGIARFVHAPGATPAVGPRMPARTPAGADDTYVKGTNDQEVTIKCEQLSSWLRRGMEKGWDPERDPPIPAPPGMPAPPVYAGPTLADVQGLPDRFGLRLGLSADNQTSIPVPATLGDWSPVMQSNNWLSPLDITFENINKVAAHAIKASVDVLQLMQEEEYITRLETDGSPERQGVFGLNTDKTVEDASRSRRADVWSDAMREVAVSGDRLYRFVTAVTGAIGESADSAISWEDEDLKQLAKDAATRQKALSERVSRFQTKLVESVVTSTLKGSKLQLDMRGKTPDDQQLVVLSADVKDSIRQITDGEAGHGFFEASVEINEALGRSARPMTIHEIVANLQNVSQAFHNQVATSMAPSSGASYSRITEPRNSFMLHLKPDTLAAIQKAYDFIVSEMRHCGGYHRPIHLWEFVEGKDWVMSTRFAELVGLMLQNTRMRSGSFAAYVGTPQLIANGHNIRMQIQRLRTQVCYYLATQMDMPMWLFEDGRTYYFGGTPKRHITPAMEKRRKRRRTAYDAGAEFGGDDGDDRFDRPDKAPRVPIIRRAILNRMLQMARVRRNDMRVLIMEGRPAPLKQYSLKGMLDYLEDPQKFVAEFGTTRGDGIRMSIAHVTQQAMRMTNAEKRLALASLYITSAVLQTTPNRDTVVCDHLYSNSVNRDLGKSLCEQLLDPAYKSVVNGRRYKVAEDGIYLQQPFEMGEVEYVKIGGTSTLCHVVRVNITGKSSATTKPGVEWQKLTGNDHISNKWVNNEMNIELDMIFHMDVTATRRRWRPHPDFKRLDAPDGTKWHNVWIKPYDSKDLKLAKAGRSAWWWVQHLKYTHRMRNIAAMSMVGAALMSGYLNSPELSSARATAWESGGLEYARTTLLDQAGPAFNPFGSGIPGQGGLDFTSRDGVTNIYTPLRRQLIRNQMEDVLGLGSSMVSHFARLRNQTSALFYDAWKETSFGSETLTPDKQKVQAGMYVLEAEVMVTNILMRLSAAEAVEATLTVPPELRAVRSPVASVDPAVEEKELKKAQSAVRVLREQAEFWRPVLESDYDPKTITEEHKKAINDPILNPDSSLTAFCAARDTILAAPRDKEFDGCRDFHNGSIKCMGSVMGDAFDSFFGDLFKSLEGQPEERMRAAVSAILDVSAEADKVGISAHILYRENIPQTIKEAYILAIKLDNEMMADGKKAVELGPARARLNEQIAFYTKFGGKLAVARGETEKYQEEVQQAIRAAYETPLESGLRPDSTWAGSLEKLWMLNVGRISGNSRAVHEVNYQSQTEVAKMLMEMKEDQRVAISQKSAISYGYIRDAWNKQTGGENFPAWVRNDGREVVLKQLRRLSKSALDTDAAEKRVLDKMAEMSVVEKSEDAFGIYVTFVAELVNELWESGKTKHLSDVFPLEEGNTGSRGKAAEVFMDSCFDVWDGRFGMPRAKEDDPGTCPAATWWSFDQYEADRADRADLRQPPRNRTGAASPPPPAPPGSPSPPPDAELGEG